jgi:TatA/E family protein of Tat protein translocase
MFGNIGTGELLIIGVIILTFFGKKKLNELAKGLGQSTKEFNKLKKEYTNIASGNLSFDETEEKDVDNEKKKEVS